MKGFGRVQVHPYAKAAWKVLTAAHSVRMQGLFSVVDIDK